MRSPRPRNTVLNILLNMQVRASNLQFCGLTWSVPGIQGTRKGPLLGALRKGARRIQVNEIGGILGAERLKHG